MPARPLHLSWSKLGTPPIELWAKHLDVVHGTNYVVPPARRAARVVSVHDLVVMRYPELCTKATLAFPSLLRRARDGGAWFQVPSHFVAGEVEELLKVIPERIRVVPYGVTQGAPAARAARVGEGIGGEPHQHSVARWLPPGTSRYVLALGTVEPRKDLPTLIKAFDALAGSFRDVALVVAGPPGWGSEAFDAAHRQARHGDRIVRTGKVTDFEKDDLLAGASVFAYPSLYEGFGFPPLEAMAAGVPVVTTTAGSLPEVVGDAAVLVAPGDPSAMADALSYLLGMGEQERKDLLARGHFRVASFSWDATAAGLEALYEDAASERAGS